MTPEERAELRKLEKEATPGPWELDVSEPSDVVVWGTHDEGIVMNVGQHLVLVGSVCSETHKDGAFVTHVRNALIPLLDALEKAEKERDELRADLSKIGAETAGYFPHGEDPEARRILANIACLARGDERDRLRKAGEEGP